MKKITLVSAIALSVALVCGNVVPQLGLGVKAAAAANSKQGKAVSARVGKPLQEADKLVKDKNFKAALAKLQEVDKMSGKSPYETYVTQELLGVVYANLKNYGEAARAFEATLASGELAPDQIPTRTKAVAQLYYQAKDYPKAIEWAQKYNRDAKDPEIQVLVGQAHYIQKNYKAASDAIQQTLKFAQAKNIAPKEEWLTLLMSADYKQQDNAGVQSALEQLVQHYPQPKYWQDLLTIVQKNLHGTSKSALDIDRLMLATGVMKDPNEYMEMAELAIQQGLPGEAKQVMEKGLQSGVLGQGTDKDRELRLHNMADREAATDQKQIASGAAEADKQKTGDADVKFGEAYGSYGQYDKAIDLIQRGIGKGVKDKDDAELRLGLAYIGSGKRPQALDAFSQITPNTAPAQIARLWTLESSNRQSASAQ